MTPRDFTDLLQSIQRLHCETKTLELKSAHEGCPKRLYDTLSSFSNQDEGGVIVFGIDETNGYCEVGVYDPQDLQRQIQEQCLQMDPVVRPVLTVLQKGGKTFVAAEISAVALADRPCHYRGQGRLRGSFTRVGDSDSPMTEYEVYSYEAFRKKYQDDVRPVPRLARKALVGASLASCLGLLRSGRPNLATLSDDGILELMNLVRGEEVSLTAALLFSAYPQAYFPQYCITAVVLPQNEVAGADTPIRFLDNQRIEGTIPEMLEAALQFVRRNECVQSRIREDSGLREDVPDYPAVAVREALSNALVHRDYSAHTEGMPIQLLMYPDHLEIRNPGGIYGRLTVDQLGEMQPDTRNPLLARMTELLGVTENRYSGIPAMRRAMGERNLPPPVFLNERGRFIVQLFRAAMDSPSDAPLDARILDFCSTPRSRKEITDFIGLRSSAYALRRYVQPLLVDGRLKPLRSDHPQSSKQRFVRGDLP